MGGAVYKVLFGEGPAAYPWGGVMEITLWKGGVQLGRAHQCPLQLASTTQQSVQISTTLLLVLLHWLRLVPKQKAKGSSFGCRPS